MRRCEHASDVGPTGGRVNLMPEVGARGIEKRRLPVFLGEVSPIRKVPAMARLVVRGAEKVRQGREEGVGRYVLVISTVLVVILFVVAYMFVV